MATDKLNIVVDAQWKGKGAVNQANKDIRNLDSGVKKTGISLTDLASGAAILGGGLFALGKAASATWEVIGQGAELQLTADKFDRLAESIGTTGDALKNDLNNNIGLAMTSANQLGLATDLMSLGLAKTHEEAVRLSTVAGKLGMDMNQLVLTLTNQTTMRFDSLGVAVDGFEEKVEALEKAGMSADEAFKWAFIEQAEQQLALVGDRAETTAGKIDAITNAVENMQNAFAMGAAEGFADTMIGITGPLEDNAAALEAQSNVAGQKLIPALVGVAQAMLATNPPLKQAIDNLGRYIAAEADAKLKADALARSVGLADSVMLGYASSARTAAGATYEYADAVAAAVAAGDLAETRQRLDGVRGPSFKSLYSAGVIGTDATPMVLNNIAGSLTKAGQAGEEAARGVGSFTSELDTAVNQMYEMAAATGDFFMQARRYKDGEYNPFESLLESADKYGAHALQLADIGVAGGLFDEAEATKYLRRTALMHRADQLGQLIARGQIDAATATGQLGNLQKALYEGRLDVADEFFAGLPVQGETDIEANLQLDTHPSWLEYTAIKDRIEANPPTVYVQVVNPGTEAERERRTRPPGNIPE